MHTFSNFLLAGSSLLLISVFASRASGFFGIPSLIVFIGVGMLAGSDGFGGIYFDDPAMAQSLGTIALIFILFSGGLETVWHEVRPVFKSALALSTSSVIITMALVGAFARYALGLTWTDGMLLGAIVSSTDAAAVFSVLVEQKVRLSARVKHLLELESGTNDPMAAFLTMGLIGVIEQRFAPGHLLWQFVQQTVLGISIGLGTGFLATRILRRIRLGSDGLYPVATTAIAVFAYSLAEAIHGSGFLSVYVVGIVLGNSVLPLKRTIALFHDGLAWLMQLIMFISLGLLVFPRRLLTVAPKATFLALFLIIIARPVSVAIALARSRFSLKEKAAICWIGLRGAVPIILATYPLLARIPQANLIFDIVFFIVLTSVLIQGTTIPYIAKWLSVEERS